METAYVDVLRVVSVKQENTRNGKNHFLEIEFLVDGEVDPNKKYTVKEKYRGYVTKVYFDKSYNVYAYDVVIY
jgi:hypothetical protein